MADDLRSRLLAALDQENQGGGITREMAADVMLDVRDEELERLQAIEAEVPAMVQKIRGLQIALNEETSARMASGRDAAEWRERAEQATAELDENTGVMQALRRQRDTAEAKVTVARMLARSCAEGDDTALAEAGRALLVTLADLGGSPETGRG